MAKTQSLDSNDLVVTAPKNRSATRQRGTVPSAELIPLQFKMPPEFVRAFKHEAINQGMRMNELLKACFTAFMNAQKPAK
jgi:hypothetical protein